MALAEGTGIKEERGVLDGPLRCQWDGERGGGPQVGG